MNPPSTDTRRPDLVLLVAYPYPPCPAPGATRSGHFAKYLRRAGYNVKVLTAFQDESQPRDEVIYVPNRQSVPDRRSVRGLSEMVLRKFFFPRDEAMVWAWDAVRAAEPVVRQYRKVVVYSTFPPLNSHLAAWRLKRKFGVRWIADFRDPMVGSPGRKFGPVPTAIYQWAQDGMFRDADAIVANTDSVLKRWRNAYPAADSKLTQIWNGFDPEDSLAAAPIPPRQRRVIAHVGAIYSGRHPVPLLQSIERLIRNGRLNPDRLLVQLVGHINWSAVPSHDVFDRLRELGCVDVGRLVPQAEARQLMREADHLLLLDIIDSDVGLQVPSKVFEYIPIGRPILGITTRNSPTDRILAGCGLPTACLYPDSTSEESDAAVLRLLSASSEPVQPSQWFLEQFDAVYRTKALADLLEGRVPEHAVTATRKQ